MEIAIAVIVSSCLLAAVILFLSRLTSRARGRGEGKRASERGSGRRADTSRACPLCFSALGPGERVKSSLFPGKADRIMHIFGCVHCWPASPSTRRTCPVCGGTLGAEAWVIARYFERPGRKHVHVLGCTECRG
jgi:hypothetical protein